MHASAIIFFVSMSLLIVVLAFMIYRSYSRLTTCVDVQSVVCNTIVCPCDGNSSVCGGVAYRTNADGLVVCSIDPVNPLKKEDP